MALPRLQDALALHQAGDLTHASAIYREILDHNPRDAMALHYLAVSAHQSGKTDEALELMRQSIDASPRIAEFHCNLGVLLRDCNRLDEAAAALGRAIQLRPRYPEALSNLGDVRRQQKKFSDAENALRQSIAIKPTASALLNLGLVLTDAKKYDKAARALRDALKLTPNDTRIVKALGIALLLDNQPDAAAQCSRAAALANDRDPDAWFGLGNALRALNDIPSALEAYGKALPLAPDHPDLLINLAATLTDAGEPAAALQVGARAVSLRPSSPQARYNLSLALLSIGQLAEGFKLYESRWQCPGYEGMLEPLDQPVWDGSDPKGKTLFIRAEQGCGDTIQFARYLPMLAQRGAKLIVECQPGLKSLLCRVGTAHRFPEAVGTAHPTTENIRIITRGEQPGDFDFHLPLLSLPLHFKTTLDSIPSEAPYFNIDAAQINAWRAKFSNTTNFKCGIVWRGSFTHRRDKDRSITLSSLIPLSQVEGVNFFSLQKEAIRHDEKNLFPNLIDLSGDLTDFSETAAALTQMDLVISVDTAIAHLAGSLARPVWTLLPFAPDWRWMQAREDSPWYPTMRLFRQEKRGNWDEAISRLATELATLRQKNVKREE
jgi:tetratricopeptide (TPR) repeat protein